MTTDPGPPDPATGRLPRRRPGPWWIPALVGVAVLGAAACSNGGSALGSSTSDAPSGPATIMSDQTWAGPVQGALVSGDGRTLDLRFGPVGPPVSDPPTRCQADYRAEADESAEEIEITLRVLVPDLPPETAAVSCTAEGHPGEATVELDAPLDGRTVTLAGTTPIPLFDASELRTPTWLPDGFVLLNQSPGQSPGMTSEAPTSEIGWFRYWGLPPSPSSATRCRPGPGGVSLTQAPPAEPYPYETPMVPVGSSTVDGHPATRTQQTNHGTGQALQNAMSWTVGDTVFTLMSSGRCGDDAILTFDDLQRVADGLR
ncbi:MAG: hypothetical protein ACXWB2_05655 [Acidimicrobiales bacterium]